MTSIEEIRIKVINKLDEIVKSISIPETFELTDYSTTDFLAEKVSWRIMVSAESAVKLQLNGITLLSEFDNIFNNPDYDQYDNTDIRTEGDNFLELFSTLLSNLDRTNVFFQYAPNKYDFHKKFALLIVNELRKPILNNIDVANLRNDLIKIYNYIIKELLMLDEENDLPVRLRLIHMHSILSRIYSAFDDVILNPRPDNIPSRFHQTELYLKWKKVNQSVELPQFPS